MLNIESSSTEDILEKIDNITNEDLACLKELNNCENILPLQSRIEELLNNLEADFCSPEELQLLSYKYFNSIEESYNNN